MGSAHAIDELNRWPAEWLTTDRVHRAGDPEYAGTSTLWNRAVTTRPAMAVRPRGAEVSISVTSARESGVGLSVRGVGHDGAGRVRLH